MSDESRSQDYRVFFSNIFSVSFGHHEVEMKFGIQKNPALDDIDMEAQCSVMVTHSGAKMLSEMFALFVADYEEATERPIDIDASKLDGLKQLIAELKVKRAEAKAAASAKK